MPAERSLSLPDARATEALGEALAAAAPAGCVIYLEGELGAGKTTLARGFLRGLGRPGRVKSPTYSLLEPYDTPAGPVLHLDLYRLADPDEAAWLGLADHAGDTTRLLVEWPEHGKDWLPAPDLVVRLAHDGERRRATLRAAGPRAPGLPERWDFEKSMKNN